ncbi:MAG: extracellular solute-binding protein [Spirochaetaceae bacterium]|nr:extracellular solute-binding protein [Spirochaetaceae bacterium]
MKNLKRADIVFFVVGLVVLGAAVASMFLFKGGRVLPPKRETIVFAQWWEDAMEEGSLAEIIADFEEEYPLVRVRLHDAAYEDIRDGLFDTEQAPPDLIAVETGRLAGIAEAGLLDVLPPMEGDGAEVADTDAGLSRYYLPTVTFLHPLYYNVDILTAAGYLRPPRTREEFLDYAKNITDTAKGVYGTAFSRNIWTDIFPWMWAGGSGTVEAVNWESRPAVNTLAFLSALHKEQTVYPSPLSKREDELLEAFMAGHIAMFVSSQASAAEVRAKKPALSFGVTTIPAAGQSEGRHVFPVTEWALAVPSKSTHKGEALSLLRYLASRKNDLAIAARGITDYRYDDPASVANQDPVDQKLRALYEASDTAAISILGPVSEKMLDETRNNMLALFAQEQTEAEAASAIQTAFTRPESAQ